MKASTRHHAAATIVATMLALVTPASASAESSLWTLVASPLTATTGVQQTFTLTATNEDPLAALLSSSEIGCVIVNVPTNFVVAGVAVTGSNAGSSWVASRAGNQVTVQAGSGGDRLALLQWVRFTVRATPMSTGSLAWSARAYRDQGCGGSGALLGVPPVVVVTAPAPTPSPPPTLAPTPTPTPTPTPAPTPTPTPTPIVPLPTPSASLPLPSLPLPSLPLPSLPPPTDPPPSASASVGASPTASEGATPPPSPLAGTASGGSDDGRGPTASGGAIPSGAPGTDGAPAAPSFGGSPDSGRGDRPASLASSVRFDEERLDLRGGSVGLFAGVEIWAVPAATMAVPGLLVLIWVALQAAGAIAWMPAVRRLQGEEDPRRRSGSGTPPR